MATQLIDTHTLETAQGTISLFRQHFSNDIKTLEFKASQYISGKHNNRLRQAIVYIITGEIKPINQCSMAMTAEYMKGALMQVTLF